MNRLVSAVLALSLLGTAAAAAQPFGGGPGGYGPGVQRDNRDSGLNQNRYDSNGAGYDRNVPNNERDDGWSQNRYGGYRGNYDTGNRRGYRNENRGRNDGAALLGLGIGLFTLGVIASSQHNADHGYRRNGGYQYGR